MDEQLGFDLGGGNRTRTTDTLFAPEDIREDALALIADARAVTADAPWGPTELHDRRVEFPLLVSWIPDEAERAQLCFDFFRELDRIEQLLAA